MFAISVPNYPNSNVETPFLGQFYICLLLVVNSNKYLSYVVDNVIFGISVPDNPSRTVESNSLRLFCNFGVFCLPYIHITTISLYMTNSKVRNSDSAYSIRFGQVLLKLFTFLINTADKEIYTFSIVFFSPITLIQIGHTHTHTNINRVLMIKIMDETEPFLSVGIRLLLSNDDMRII